jgi:cation:H+ antiporter
VLWEALILLVGLAIIYIAGRLLISGASSAATELGLTPLVVGATIVAFGTSAPELFLAFFSALEGEAQVSIGNVIGANINNLTLVLGVFAVLLPIVCGFDTVRREAYAALLAVGLMAVFAWDGKFEQWEGVVMLVSFIGYLEYLRRCFRGCAYVEDKEKRKVNRRVLTKGLVFIIISIGALALGAELTVTSAVDLATELGISTLVIGITVISVGTVLPEITVSIIAAREKQQDIAIGNLLGTLIFNTLVVAGTAAAISGVVFARADVYFGLAMIFGLLVAVLVVLRYRGAISRVGGAVLLAVYLAFTLAIVVFG